MTEVFPAAAAAAAAAATTDPAARSRIVLPLWVAAISLAVIAVVMIIGSIQLVQALQQTQASVLQLQQQVRDLGSGLGGLLGG